MEKIVEIEGKKYKLIPIDADKIFDSFGSPPQTPQPSSEEPVEFVKAVPKVKTGIEMMKETATRIGEARINRATENIKMKKQYDAKIGREVANKDLFYGEGAADLTGGEEEV